MKKLKNKIKSLEFKCLKAFKEANIKNEEFKKFKKKQKIKRQT